MAASASIPATTHPAAKLAQSKQAATTGQIARLLWVSKKKNFGFPTHLAAHLQAALWEKGHKSHTDLGRGC